MIKFPPGLLINTTKGPRAEAAMERRDGVVDNENEHTEWVEFWEAGEIIHRSVSIVLKQLPPAGAEIGIF